MSDIITQSLIDALERQNVEYRLDFSVGARSTFKIGGEVAIALFPKTQEQLVSAVLALENVQIKYEMIGNASNMLFAFDRYEGAFVFTAGLDQCSVCGEYVECDAGVSLAHIANFAAKKSLTGFEFAFGIPGLVGGSVYMNAGAYGGQMSDVIVNTVALNKKTGQICKIDDARFGYRESIYMHERNLICLGATLKLARGDEREIRTKMAENINSRREKQPVELASAGSYFKRPATSFAGKLIEDCGLKGFTVGEAQVSPKHAGFIVNLGGANWRDVLELEEIIKEKVAREFGVALEREVRVISD